MERRRFREVHVVRQVRVKFSPPIKEEKYAAQIHSILGVVIHDIVLNTRCQGEIEEDGFGKVERINIDSDYTRSDLELHIICVSGTSRRWIV